MKLALRPRTEREVRICFARTRDPEIQARIPRRSQTVEQALEDYRRSAAPGADSYGRQSFYLERDIGNKEEVQMDYIVENNRIAGEQDGKVLAEITFPEKEPGVVVIDHTWVDPSLRGQGAAGQLVKRAAGAIRQSGRKARVTCSYARTWFENHPEETDILAEGWQADPAACRLGR